MVWKSVRDVEVEIELPNAFQDHGPASRMNQLILLCAKMLVNYNIRNNNRPCGCARYSTLLSRSCKGLAYTKRSPPNSRSSRRSLASRRWLMKTNNSNCKYSSEMTCNICASLGKSETYSYAQTLSSSERTVFIRHG